MTAVAPGLPEPPRAVPADIPLPAVAEPRPGIWSVPIPLEGNPLRYVVVYVIEVPGGLAMIDAGWGDELSWQALTAGLSTIGAGVADVRSVLVTHVHPDHYGLAPRIRESSGASVGLHPADLHMLARNTVEADELLGEQRGWLEMAGAPQSAIDDLNATRERIHRILILSPPDVLLEPGQRVNVPGYDLMAIHTPGHTDGHLCFHDAGRGILFAGDHVLPKISPNIATLGSRVEDPLSDYIRSLRAVRDLHAPAVLPAHVGPIEVLAERVDDLLDHHEQRLHDIYQATRSGPASIWEVAATQDWKRGWDGLEPFMRRSAAGEAHAHLVLLEQHGLLRSVVSDDGVKRFEAVAGDEAIAGILAAM